jgi:hypothetical protein
LVSWEAAVHQMDAQRHGDRFLDLADGLAVAEIRLMNE